MYVLHYYPDTASLAVRMVLAELGVQHRCELIDREAGVLSSPAYRKMQPLGLIPAMETPDGTMFETAAILLYLADRHPGLAPAVGSPDRGDFLKWLFFLSNTAHADLRTIFEDNPADAQALNAYGYTLVLSGTWNDVYAGVNLSPFAVFKHDFEGNSHQTGNFIEGRKAYTLGLRASYLNSLEAEIQYTEFMGAGQSNSGRDRDNIGLNVKYSF